MCQLFNQNSSPTSHGKRSTVVIQFRIFCSALINKTLLAFVAVYFTPDLILLIVAIGSIAYRYFSRKKFKKHSKSVCVTALFDNVQCRLALYCSVAKASRDNIMESSARLNNGLRVTSISVRLHSDGGARRSGVGGVFWHACMLSVLF